MPSSTGIRGPVSDVLFRTRAGETELIVLSLDRVCGWVWVGLERLPSGSEPTATSFERFTSAHCKSFRCVEKQNVRKCSNAHRLCTAAWRDLGLGNGARVTKPGKASTYLITGGAGFIGSNVADHFLGVSSQVTILDNFSRHGSEQNLEWLRRRHGSALRVIRADIRDSGPVLDSAIDGADVVFHFAGQVAVTTSVTDPRHDFDVNALGTFNVLEAARRARSQPVVVYSSTNKVYGKMADLGMLERNGRYEYESLCGAIPESRPLDPYSPYGCSKCAGDQYVLDYARIYGMRTLVFRQSCIYGPRQFGMEDQGWLAWFCIRAAERRPVTIYGDGKQVRDVLHVRDLIAAYGAALNRMDVTSGRAYNVGGGPQNTLSLLELIEILNRKFGRKLECSFQEWRPGDQPVFISDISRATRDFGWRPKIGVEEGIGHLIEWISEDRAVAVAAGAREGNEIADAVATEPIEGGALHRTRSGYSTKSLSRVQR